MQRNAIKDARTRRSKLVKYVPDVSRSLFGLLDGMRQRRRAADNEPLPEIPHKKMRLDPNVSSQIIEKLDGSYITEDSIQASLLESIDSDIPNTFDFTKAIDTIDAVAKAKNAVASLPIVPIYLVPLFNFDDTSHDVIYPLFTFRPIVPLINASKGS